MPKFAANLTMLFNEVEFPDRFAAAAEAGFAAVEFLFPYPYPKEVLMEKVRRHNLTVALHNLPAGDWAGGERGVACLPGREKEFKEGVSRAVEYATALNCKQINCLAGLTLTGGGTEGQRATLIDNLRYAAPRLADAGIALLLEPVNTRDVPGFFVNRTAQALEIIDAVGSDNLFLQYDIYHSQVMEGNLAPTIERNLARIRHVQLADNPGRHEPGTGEIRYDFLFDFLDRLGYDGWIGCEYKPAAETKAGLGWFEPFRRK